MMITKLSIKNKLLGVLSAGLILMGSVVPLPAEPILEMRCGADSLDPTKALYRNNWARKCALVNNVQDPSKAMPIGWGFYEYKEFDSNSSGNKSFIGVNSGYQVNQNYKNTLYLDLIPAQTTDSHNNLTWYKWFGNSPKARPTYPTYGDNNNINVSTQLYPPPAASSANWAQAECQFYYDQNGTQPAPAGSNFVVNGYCRSSCYTPEQELLFSDGYDRIVNAVEQRRTDLITLKKGSNLSNLQFQENRVKSYTAEFRDTKHLIYEIKTASGGQLRITDEHPMVRGDGRLVQAKSLKLRDQLIKQDGSKDTIVSIEKKEHFGKVYNIDTVTNDPVTKILVAQGYLTGSSAFQNEDVGYINRMILNRSIPEELLPR